MFKPSIKTRKFFLIIGDIFLLYFALFLTLLLRYNRPSLEIWQAHFLLFSIIYFIWLIIFYINGLYKLTLIRPSLKFFSTLIQSFIIGGIIAATFFYFIPYFVPYFKITPKTNLFLVIIILIFLLTIWRFVYYRFSRSEVFLENLLIITKKDKLEETKEITSYIEKHPELGYKIKRAILEEEFFSIKDFLKEKVQTIVLNFNLYQEKKLIHYFYSLLPLRINLIDFSIFWEKIFEKIPLSYIKEIWFLENLLRKEKRFYELSKRVIDIIFSLFLGFSTVILFPFIYFFIKINSPGPVFFRQKRAGKDGKIFFINKFRTMIKEAEKEGPQWAKEKDPRITTIGHFLRKAWLDELPQFLNILKGEMSIVGPRPERPEFIEKLKKEIPFYRIRLLTKPGLTGWAQVNFPYGDSIEDAKEKLQYELFYLKNQSFLLDLSIILKTIKTILTFKGQ